MTEFRSVGVVGGGLIGMSWASLFAAMDLPVLIVEPDPAAAARLADFAPRAWESLRALGLTRSASPRMPDVTDAYAALHDVDFIQENGPECLSTKRRILERIEDVARPDVVIASSTSSLMASDLQAVARAPERILVAHPMNPPHLIPMVELVAGRRTSEDAVARAEHFYAEMQRVTIRVKREVPGHLANRLTSALYREAVHLVAEGIADVADVDRAVAYGPGLRWALMGPHLTYHMGGGQGGYRAYLDHLGPTQEARWQELGEPSLDAELKTALVDGLDRALAHQDEATLTARRDAALVHLLKLKAQHGL